MCSIQAIALQRFEAEGFDAITVEDIAREAGVSASTIYRYFRVKEELVVWDEKGSVISAALECHLGTMPPFDALRSAFVEVYTLSVAEESALRIRTKLIDSTPALLAFQIARLETERKELVTAMAAAYHRTTTDLELDLIARISIAALCAGFECWQSYRSTTPLSKWISDAFDAALSACSG